MSRKSKKKSSPQKVQKAPEDKKRLYGNAIRLLSLIATTIVVLLVYKILLNHFYFKYVLIAYMTLSTAAILTYVIYNRGFSRKGLTVEMLPTEWSDEEKKAFIEDGEQRLRRSRPLLIIVFAFIFTFLFDAFELFAIPLIKEMFGA